MEERKITVSNILFCVIFLLFTLFFVVPFFYGLYLSFTNLSGVTQNYEYIGFDNYRNIFNDTRVLNSLQVSFRYLCLLLPASLIFGYLNAKVLHRLRKTKSAALFISFLPYLTMPVVASLLFSQLYYRFFTSIGEVFNIEFLKINLLASSNTALYAVALVDLWMLVPFSTLLFFSAMDAIPINLVNASKLDGAKNIRAFIHIKLPYLLPTIGTLTIILIVYAFTYIDTIMSLTSGGHSEAQKHFFMLSIEIQSLTAGMV